MRRGTRRGRRRGTTRARRRGGRLLYWWLGTPWADARNEAVAVRIAVGGHQVSADLTVALGPPRIVAVGHVPGDRLEAPRGIDLLASADDRAPAKPWPPR